MLASQLPNVATTIFTRMSQLAAEVGAINLSQGFPDFDGPQALREAVARHVLEGRNQYCPMTGLPALLGFMLFGQCIALFVASGSAIWAMLSPVFVPMFMLLGYHPAFVQLAFRAGDTSLNSIMLVNPFLPLFIDMLQKYKSESGIGTYLSLMVPYAFTYMVTWYLLFSAWYFFELPIGPGIGQRLM